MQGVLGRVPGKSYSVKPETWTKLGAYPKPETGTQLVVHPGLPLERAASQFPVPFLPPSNAEVVL